MSNFIEKSVQEIFDESMANAFIREKVEPIVEKEETFRDGLAARMEEDRLAKIEEEKKLVEEQELKEKATKMYKGENATTSDEKNKEITEKSVKNTITINPDLKETIVGRIYASFNEKYLSEKKAKKDYDGDGKIESGKDEYFGSKDKAIKKAMKKESMKEGYGSKKKKKKSYGESTNKLGLKSWQSMLEGSYGEIDRPVEKESDTPEVKADVCFDAGAAIPTTIKGTGDPRELPTAINLMKNKYRAQGIMASKEPDGKLVEGMATPESGTGKYYNEKKPTAMQLAKRKKMDKVKSLTNQGKHKEASALYKEGIDVIKDILTKEVVDEKISASGYARAKKWREDQARAKDKKEQEHYANKAKTHKWDGEKWNKRES